MSIEGLVGSTGPDELTGNRTLNTIWGIEGHYTINGGDTGDNLIGGNGNDELNGEDGGDFLDGQAGTDELDGGTGNDVCFNGETHTSCETIGATALGPAVTAQGPPEAMRASGFGTSRSPIRLMRPMRPRYNWLAFVGPG